MRQIVLDSLMITGFVTGMMLLVEYLNVLTQGKWSQWFVRKGFRQYVLAGLLGAVPGCLGAFTAVALYSHNIISFGAVVAAMIASSGDEAFVMLALIPETAAALIGTLVVLGILAGFSTDLIARNYAIGLPRCKALIIHSGEQIGFLNGKEILAQWKDCSAARGILGLTLLLFGAALASGQTGPATWDWVRISLVLVTSAALIVVAIVPDHFVEDHLWRHVVRGHAPRIFLWTLSALFVAGPLLKLLNVEGSGDRSGWLLLLMACAVGLIPQSGPHLVFVTLYAQHAIPFGVLLASSIVQDGHGMLPMLAHSRRAFVAVKLVNCVVGLAAGATAMLLRI